MTVSDIYSLSKLSDNSESIEALDLAKSIASSGVGQKVSSVAKPHYLYVPLLQPTSTAPTTIHRSVDAVKNMISSDVEIFSSLIDYNGLNAPLQFIQSLPHETSGDLSEDLLQHSLIQTFIDFQIDARKEIWDQSGSACSGQTLHIMNFLQNKYGLKGYNLVEKNNAIASAHHSIGAIFCEDGIVLVDLSLNAKNSKVIAVKQGTIATGKNIYHSEMQFSIDLASNTIQKKTLFADKPPALSEIPMQIFENENQAVMKNFLLLRPWYAITGCDETGIVRSVIRVDLGQEKLIFQKGAGSTAIKFSIPFSQFAIRGEKLDSSHFSEEQLSQFEKLGDNFFDYFKIPQKSLFSQIGSLVKNKRAIQLLFHKTHAPKTPAP